MKLNKHQLKLCENINYKFLDNGIFLKSLSHASSSIFTGEDNQRLEFLGDRVLALIISDELLKNDPEANEGKLAPRLNVLVRKETCAEIAKKIKLGYALVMGKSECVSGGRRKNTILADAMEALIAAIYLDGGIEEARRVILFLWSKRINFVEDNTFEAKSALQEWAQARGMPPPSYVEKNKSGPDHSPYFSVEVILENGEKAEGSAASKRNAQQIAASNLLLKLEKND